MEEKDANSFSGLLDEEAAELQRRMGYNEIPSSEERGILAIAYEIVKEPMFLLLIGGGLIYMLIGDTAESLMLLFFVFIVMGITFYQERKTERALSALRDMTSPRALVIRGGRHLRVAGREVVPGDVVILSEGDRVPADCVMLISSNLLVDESFLTGESAPVRKVAGREGEGIARPGGEDLPFVYSGTLICQGRGIAKVLKTGASTEIGRIGKALKTVDEGRSPLRIEMDSLVKKFAIISLLICAFVVVGYGLTRNQWANGFLAGIALAMAILPEEIPVIMSIFFAIGAWRISKINVLTRRLQAIEALGSATVLCVDKTGTLTMNRMTVSKVFAGGGFCDIAPNQESVPEAFHEVIEYGLLASQAEPFDPMEKGLRAAGRRVLSKTEHIHANWTLVHEYPLSRGLLSLSNVWKSPSGDDYIIASKGAPEAVIDLCHLDPKRIREVEARVTEMADLGLRVLGVAKAHFKRHDDLPQGQHDFHFEFLGLLGFTDPIREAVSPAVRDCYKAGIRVIMITGDYPGTAQNVAKQIGLEGGGVYITGAEMVRMSQDTLRERVKTVNIFARVVPEQKLLLVEALKADGEVVAMTGDGVNDAPALKSAHIGIAMGSRGTDVAREAAALVLQDDDFTSIVSAVRMGRRIFDNLRKALAYVLAVHIPIVGMAILPAVVKWPLALMPAHIAFLELIIDPACSTVFEAEPEESNVMSRKPRTLGKPVFSRRDIALGLAQGLMLFLIVANVYGLVLYRGGSAEKARALAFVTLVVGNLSLIITNRSWVRSIFETVRTPNRAMYWVFAGAAVFLGLILWVPQLSGLFSFESPHLHDIALAAVAGALSIVWFEALKAASRRIPSGFIRIWS